MDKLILGTVYLAKAILYGFVAYIIVFLVLKLVNGRKMDGKYVQCFVEYSFVVYIITLMQITGIADIVSWSFTAGKAFNWIPFVNEDMRLLFLNVLLFIPMGMFLPMILHRNWSFWKIGLIGMGISLLIEMIQLF
ncbi:MAG: VanZ family protein [Firmicutes bacterium]|nr:VanZ family protein [Bacillota bacterium]